MKIAVMGAGGVGGYFGGLLARAGHSVTFVARGAHLAAIQAKGLRIESSNDGDFTVPGTALEDTSKAEQQELVLFAVKMYHNSSAIQTIRPLVGPDTVVLTLQNGIDNGEQLVAAFGRARVMIGSAYLEGRIKEPGVVSQSGPGTATFGELQSGLTERGQRLLEVFQEAGLAGLPGAKHAWHALEKVRIPGRFGRRLHRQRGQLRRYALHPGDAGDHSWGHSRSVGSGPRLGRADN